MQSSVKPSDFHRYVQQVEACFDRWSTDPSDMLNEDYRGICDVEFELDSPTKVAVYKFAKEHSANVTDTICLMMKDVLNTTRTQMKDYLEGGKYSTPLSYKDQKTLQNCPLTNLLAENAFGDMDFDMGKRRHATFHHRSSTHMLQHNKAASWLSEKEEDAAAKLLCLVRKLSKHLRDHHRRQEKIVTMKIREKRLENERQKCLREAAVAKNLSDLVRPVLAHGGPCETKTPVKLLRQWLEETGQGPNAIKEALKNEIRFQKTVLNSKGTLKLSGSITSLSKALQDHLPLDHPAHLTASIPPS